MKKNFILFLFAFLLHALVHAAPPTVSASNLVFSLFDGNRLGGTCTAGNGSARIFVMKQGAPVTGVPVNGVDYTYNSAFGTPAAAFTAPGEFVVGLSIWGDFTVTNLQPGTVYYLAIFEKSGSGSATQYLNVPLTGSASTVVAPTVQTTTITSSSATGNTIGLSWTRGNGSGRIVLARKGAPVDASPADLSNYWEDVNLGAGGQVGTGNYVVYKGAGTSVTVRSLEPNTTYHFAVFEYNGSVYPMFLRPGATASFTTNAGPNIAPSAIGTSWVDGNRFTLGCTIGNGTRRLFIMRKGAAVTATPVNGTVYTANAVFGTAGTEIAPDEFVVGAGTGSGVSVTNLEPNTIYHVRVFEYDQTAAGVPYYLTSSFAAGTGSTSLIPTTLSTLSMGPITGSTASIALVNGNGTYRMVILKAGSAVDAVPQNLTAYSGNTVFGSGTHLGGGNYVVASGINGSPLTVSGLQPGTTYHAAVYELNGSSYPVYSASCARISFTIPLQPTAAATAAIVSARDGKSFRIQWTNGNGGRRIVVARKGAAVASVPQDGQAYTANENFGLGTQMNAGEYVVYNGTGYYFDLKNLDFASAYHFAVFEYNEGAGGNTDYLPSPYLAFTGATVSAPTSQPALSSVSGITATSANINFTSGNGANRIIVIRQGSAVDALPQDGMKYAANSSFGTASAQMGAGNYVILSTSYSGYASVSNLQPNTLYYTAAFEFNGNNEPVYLRSAMPSISFTTTDVPGAAAPTVAATAPVVNNVEGNKLTFKWTNGNGANRIVIMRKDAAVNFVPASATSYAANAAFGSGTDLGGGQYIVYSGNGSTVDITNLQPSSTYHLAVYEYNGTGSLLRYGSTALTAMATTLMAPATTVSSVQTATSSGRLTLAWTNGSGSARMVILKDASAVTAMPVDLTTYPFSTNFGSGPQAAAGEYIVYNASGNTVTVTGLVNGHTYHYAIYEYNGATGPVYNTIAVKGTAVVSSALPVQLTSFSVKEVAAGVQLDWCTAQEWNNDRFVIERSDDGTTYRAIGSVAGAVSSQTPRSYRFIDAAAMGETAYYRLKQVDRDGQFTYSPVQVLRKKGATVQVLPNPVVSNFRMMLPAGVTSAEVRVYDAGGREVLKQQVQGGQAVDAMKLKAGYYLVSIRSGERVWASSIVKQ